MDFAVGNLTWSSNQLASNFYSHSENIKPQENLFLSTLGITSLLTMIHLSSWNDSSLHIKECLNSDLPNILDFTLLKEYLNSTGMQDQSHIFRQNIFIFHSNNITVSNHYSQMMQTIFQVNFIPINFADINASAVINKHLENFSSRKLTHFVHDGTLSADMKLAIFNGIYFKGKWQHEFLKENTKIQKFHIPNGKTVSVNMMFIRQKFCVKEDNNLEYKSIKIPYVGRHQDMYILLPTVLNGIFDLEKKLNPEFINLLLSDVNCQKTLTDLYLPKFQHESSFDMDMIHFIFQNWTGHYSDSKKMTKMWHQAMIDVTEEGTEAIATSGAVIGLMGPQTTRFIVDHPFLFLIVDQRFKIVVFIGKVVNPNK